MIKTLADLNRVNDAAHGKVSDAPGMTAGFAPQPNRVKQNSPLPKKAVAPAPKKPKEKEPERKIEAGFHGVRNATIGVAGIAKELGGKAVQEAEKVVGDGLGYSKPVNDKSLSDINHDNVMAHGGDTGFGTPGHELPWQKKVSRKEMAERVKHVENTSASQLKKELESERRKKVDNNKTPSGGWNQKSKNYFQPKNLGTHKIASVSLSENHNYADFPKGSTHQVSHMTLSGSIHNKYFKSEGSARAHMKKKFGIETKGKVGKPVS